MRSEIASLRCYLLVYPQRLIWLDDIQVDLCPDLAVGQRYKLGQELYLGQLRMGSWVHWSGNQYYRAAKTFL